VFVDGVADVDDMATRWRSSRHSEKPGVGKSYSSLNIQPSIEAQTVDTQQEFRRGVKFACRAVPSREVAGLRLLGTNDSRFTDNLGGVDVDLRFKKAASCGALVAAMFAVTTAHANLVTNGGFETGDFSGWTTAIDGFYDGVDSAAPQAGNFAAFFGNPGISTISQKLATAPNTTYLLTFWLMVEGDPNGNAAPNSFSFDWNGAPGAPALVNSGPTGYKEFQYFLTANSASTELAFNFSDTPAFIDFDSVSVTVPEPTSLALVLGALGAALATRRRSSAKSETAEGAG
jgi:hypothetical protein